MQSSNDEHVAAIDLGSNSFHMIVAQSVAGQLQVVDRMRETVRLAAGLDENNCISGAKLTQALECLRRFGQRLEGLKPRNVRAVGTNTLRKARNRTQFLADAQQALGHRIDIIAGREEARLIYLGVSHSLEDGSERRLVIDIGGGSTEFILGRQFKPENLESLHMGCVQMSNQYFPTGAIEPAAMRAAEIAALRELESIHANFTRLGWDSSIGASGTILAIQETIAQQGWDRDGISLTGLRKLRAAIIAAGHVDKLGALGVGTDRAPVFPGGLAILLAAFEALKIATMRVSSGALREGLLYDLLGRIHHEDVRERTIESLQQRAQASTEQARRVSETALELWRQAPASWNIGTDDHMALLRWAAQLHELGLAVAHNQYHKHGAYLVQNMDLAGFSQGEQQQLAILVRGHRRSFPLAEFKLLPDATAKTLRYLCVLLRLAVLLRRSQTDTPMPDLRMEFADNTLKLKFPEAWLDEHPLTQADLEQEATYLKAADLKLKFK
jgi:exopolyphosphatase / guanosine-5'-triphosphate,3'-diphosphate pyrophosphatase